MDQTKVEAVDPNGRYMMHFIDFEGEKHLALVEGDNIVQAAEAGEQDHAEDMAEMVRIETEQSFLKAKQETARKLRAERLEKQAKFQSSSRSF